MSSITGRNTHDAVERTATTTEADEHFDVDYIFLIVNDGTDDIYINFDLTTATDTKLTVKPNESISDFPRKASRLYFRSKSGSQPFRAWGVK